MRVKEAEHIGAESIGEVGKLFMAAVLGKFKEFGAAERAGWTSRDVAENYVAHFTDAADQAMEGMIAAVSPESGKKVLDLSAGTSLLALSAAFDRRSHGQDAAQAMTKYITLSRIKTFL